MFRSGGRGNSLLRLNILYRFVQNIKLLPSMIKDYCQGKYRRMPYWTFGGLLLSVLYILSPLDAIPDYILGLGQIDDILVVWLCMLLMERDLTLYRAWKENHPS